MDKLLPSANAAKAEGQTNTPEDVADGIVKDVADNSLTTSLFYYFFVLNNIFLFPFL